MPRTHAALRRLFVDTPLGQDAVVSLDRDQANYLLAVLRMQTGDTVVLFNGRDGAWLGAVEPQGRKAAAVRLLEQIAPQPPAATLWFGFAPLKIGRLDYLVQKATEMGAGTIQPVTTRFTQVAHVRSDKLRANIIEAAEQCEVLTVPELAPQVTLAALLADWSEDRVLVFADEAEASASPLAALAPLAGRPLGVLIGPEGGFSEDERQALRARPYVQPISLGPRILRADTAAVAALAVIQASIGDWR